MDGALAAPAQLAGEIVPALVTQATLEDQDALVAAVPVGRVLRPGLRPHQTLADAALLFFLQGVDADPRPGLLPGERAQVQRPARRLGEVKELLAGRRGQ